MSTLVNIGYWVGGASVGWNVQSIIRGIREIRKPERTVTIQTPNGYLEMEGRMTEEEAERLKELASQIVMTLTPPTN